MSFFDDRDDPPRRSSFRQRPGGDSVDRQTLMVRRTVAAAGALVAIVLLVLLVKGCMGARKERALKDYVRDASALVQESDQQSDALFGLFRQPPSQSSVEVQNTVNGFRTQAATLVDRAKKTGHPGEVDRAQRFLVETLELRRDGVGGIARELPTALGSKGRAEAGARIARLMESFLASDVVFTQRFVPSLRGPLDDHHVLGQVQLPTSKFLPDIDWLRPTTVVDKLSRIRGGASGPVAPGLHGTSLAGVTVDPGGKALTPGAPVDIPAGDNVVFNVQLQNGGENDETDVVVRITTGGTGKPVEREATLDAIAAGETKAVKIPLATTPPTGRPVTVKVEVQAVPGEDNTDNNRGEFQVVFTR